MATMIQPDPVIVHAIEDMLRLVAMTRAEKPRDPLRALEDRLLDMRAAVTK